MLVNPYTEGSVSKVFKADNSLKAAKMAYDNISKYFNNSVHNFKFTMLKLKSDSVNDNDERKSSNFDLEQYGGSSNNKRFNPNNFSHFTVSERISRSNTVNYEITPYTGKIDNLQHLIDNVMGIQQKFTKAAKTNRNINRLSESSYSETEQSGSGNSESSETENSSSEQLGGYNDDNETSSYQRSNNEDNAILSATSSQFGGKKSKYDDDDDDDDSPDYYVKKYYDPIAYWYYSPSIYPYDRLYLPTFISPLSFPYVLDLFTPSITKTDPVLTVNL